MGLVRNPAAYAYDIILTILVSNISYIDSKRELTNANLKKFLYFVLIITIAGIFMAILRPNIWGFLPISFSRTDRGEIITLGFTGGAAVLPILAFIVKNISFSLRILILILSLGLTLSSGSRTFLYFLISPALIYVFFNTSGRKRIYLSIFTFVILFLFLYDYKDILLNTNERDLNTTENSLNGRGILWLFYWNKFLESPFFGQGAFLLNTFSNSYAGEATSEIGVLKSAAEYGLLLASCQIIVVLLAVANSFKLLKTKNSNEIEIFASYYIILSFPYFIFESLSRINTSNAYFFWYLVFFIYFRQNHYSKNKIPSN
ncbi:MAG: O-antigen ligase family protein [Rhodoferax sp.]|nr:O-antigen ligase family protein [Rhodoferax sp.]